MNGVIVWFRRDLRLRDNPTLRWARAKRWPIVAVYIDALDDDPWQHGAASRWWLHQSLGRLEQRLAGHGIRLHFFQGRVAEILEGVVRNTGVSTVAWNALGDPHLEQRDSDVERYLAERGVDVLSFDEDHLHAPASVLNQQARPYKVFTPFWKRLRSRLVSGFELPGEGPGLPSVSDVQLSGATTLDGLGLCAGYPWHDKLHAHWTPGEEQAWRQLDSFLENTLTSYEDKRERPAFEGTSRLSPHLHFGEITAVQILRALLPRLDGKATMANAAEAFLRQLGWREFARYVLWHFPHTTQQCMDARFNDDFWRMDDQLFRAWRDGRTGVPIVDAGMRQLWESGWMHNRVRMLVASFFTKNLGLPWQAGARWFWDTLVDADLANNTLGWQWVAGCGVDAAPYFRIFNPLTQAERFDADGVYCMRWSDAGDADRPTRPLVDIKASRQQALERYKTQIQSRATS